MSTNLKKLLAGELPENELQLLIGRFDVVGDIAVVIIPDALERRCSLIAETILATNHHLKTVLRRAGIYDGEFRTLPLELIGGENRTVTEVREFGFHYRLDLETCYFSVRSGSERKRIAELVGSLEKVLVLFSGVAPYPLMIAGLSGAQVVGVEKNPAAHEFALENVRKNKLVRQIELYCCDAVDFLQECQQKFDRVIMPLPRGGEPFLAQACSVLKEGGVLHYYKMAVFSECEMVAETIRTKVLLAGHEAEKVEWTAAGHCGNKIYRWCFDVTLK